MVALSDITIAPTAIEHVEGIIRVIDIVGHERKYFDVFEAPPSPESRALIRNEIASGDPHFVALAGDEVVGWCEIIRSVFAANARGGTLNIGIIPAFRDRGVGSRLIAATLERARRAGFVRIALYVHADNFRAIALYEKVGFVREGVLKDAALIDGKYRDSLVMAIVDRANAVTPTEGPPM
jgi:ribosomal protein S18 acetylase RimI-like enzyme